MRGRRHSLRGRIVLTIIGSVIATSAIFGLAAFAIAYTTEDRLFRERLSQEVAFQTAAWRRSGALTTPNNSTVTIYRGQQHLPPEIQKELLENPQQSEFYGQQGRHYHIQRFDLNEGISGAGRAPAIAVIEVSGDLLVRPYRNSFIVLLAGLSLMIATVMAAFGWWLVNRAMQPLSALARDVAGAGSEIPILNAKDYPTNEIGTLAEVLEQAFARISGFVQRERAFTRDASHELRTPLAVISGAAEVIALNRDLPSGVAEPLRRIETATTDMVLALDQLLALARENHRFCKERVRLRPLIDKAVSWSRARHPGSLIEVFTEVDINAAVLAHPTSLQLVLNNLIGNSFQHVGAGQLLIRYVNGSLSISDDGPGFEPGTDPFAPFAKGIGSSGSGLGLDISRRLCNAAGIGLFLDEAEGSRKGVHLRLEFCGL